MGTVDFKGRYGLEVEDEDALVAMYGAVARRVPGRAARGPARVPEVEALLAPVSERVSFDAPIRTPSE